MQINKTTVADFAETKAQILAVIEGSDFGRFLKGPTLRDLDELTSLNNIPSLLVEQAWAVGATVSIRLETDMALSLASQADIGRIVCEISWSSTGRSVGEATAAMALYRKAVELAALIEASCRYATFARAPKTQA